MSKKHPTMVIAYDFDGTLAKGNMQEHQFLPNIKMKPKEFWNEAKKLAKKHQADEILVYMDLMLKEASKEKVSVKRDVFKNFGKGIKLFKGVEEWFDRIEKYGKEKKLKIEHVLISSGNYEIFAGTSIFKKFSHVYASKFMFNENDVPTWPALAVNYTAKTQYLFRINKDAHDLSDNTKVNKFTEKCDRPVPFENMVFIGDGSTDIPCFRLVKEQGGLSVAVYKPRAIGAKEKAKQYRDEGRVHCVAIADYSEGGKLDRIIKANIDVVVARDDLNHYLNKK